MAKLVENGQSQFLIATHSPILMTCPGATIVDFDKSHLPAIPLEDTAHYKVTRRMLENPEAYWKHLLESGDTE